MTTQETIEIEVDRYGYEGGPVAFDAKASAEIEARAVRARFAKLYPSAEIEVEIVSNGRGTRVISEHGEQNEEYANVIAELTFEEAENWRVSTEDDE